ncbi:SUKH-4 family immunity protein [Dactylosporangium aurantiacum]|uniref:SUKH-4 family immunity protein n=1 Tax=Dactylosporangium aurantiacum TaxID=35754 RepID=A0A9Q9MI76_9ACTN|nr:SUKH-4 family immunity protein [Dactylosporangium aurantiacum]MDG6103098.1 SUKH-4 family immunity protein [Dactylosporangium aurantiacum]UWZ57609.1 SUKH-4 family immunity protein [Dactylosporangium aurantiacum]
MGPDDATLGVVLDTTAAPAEVVVDGERLVVIGYVWEPATELVCLDGAGAVWSCSPDRRGRMPMNSSVDALRRFLDLFGAFFAAADDPPPATYTAAQLAEKLAAFRRGEITPAAGGPDRRSARVERLRTSLREVDGGAVEAGWWALVLEQVDDGIL